MYSLYTTPSSFVIKREDGKDSILVIDRSDNGNLEIKTNADVPSLGLGTYYKVMFCLIGIVRIGGDAYLIIATHATNVATISGSHILRITATEFISMRTGLAGPISTGGENEPPYHQMQSLLSSGHFYFSNDHRYDITRSLQLQPDVNLPIWERVDVRFFWNKFVQRDIITHQLTDWCIPVMEGFVESKTGGHINGKLSEMTIVSRRSRFRAGTRYNSRGIDDDGNVANFVETEQILSVDKYILSFVQIRGSVPVFWEQTSAQLGKFSDIKITKFSEIGKFANKVSNKIQLCRTPQSTSPAFSKHFKDLLSRYGSPICLNLLSVLKGGEKTLIEAFEHQMKTMGPSGVRYMYFDFAESCKGGAKMDRLDSLIAQLYESKELTMLVKTQSSSDNTRDEKQLQATVVRTNCKDCLDRTNLAQSRVAWKAFEYYLRNVGLVAVHQPLEDFTELRMSHMALWANNGDEISVQYAGSGSLKSSITRTGETSIKGWLDDGKKSVTRFYMGNFKDSARQEGIEQLLGLHPAVKVASQAEMAIQKALAGRLTEFTSTAPATIFVGTFNAGAQDPGYESLSEWLDTSLKGIEKADIYAIGLQEVCELTPGKILNTDPERGLIWEREIKRYLPGYVQVQSHQLVGLLLCIFVKEDVVDCIRDVQYEITKVGLRGMAGNKGGIAVHMVFHNSSLCFVTAHLAAGQSNVDERNADFVEINEQTAFGRRRNFKIFHHHYVFWFGDFNYRVDLPDEEVRRCIAAGDLNHLLKYDQLVKARQAGQVFQHYHEAPIIFSPTYKYDMHTQIYDTSPKNRAPAWTDRILWKQQDSQHTSLLFYDRAEITLSDHRPVSAYFKIDVKKTDKEKERQVRRQIISSKSYLPNGADVKDFISWDEAPTASNGSNGAMNNSMMTGALLDFDFDPRGTLNNSPLPASDPSRISPQPMSHAQQPAHVQLHPASHNTQLSHQNPPKSQLLSPAASHGTKKLPAIPPGSKPAANQRHSAEIPGTKDFLQAPNLHPRTTSPVVLTRSNTAPQAPMAAHHPPVPTSQSAHDVFFDPFNNYPMPPQQQTPQYQSPPPTQYQSPPPSQYQPPPTQYQSPPPTQYQSPPPTQYQSPPPSQYQSPPPTQYQSPPPAQYQSQSDLLFNQSQPSTQTNNPFLQSTAVYQHPPLQTPLQPSQSTPMFQQPAPVLPVLQPTPVLHPTPTYPQPTPQSQPYMQHPTPTQHVMHNGSFYDPSPSANASRVLPVPPNRARQNSAPPANSLVSTVFAPTTKAPPPAQFDPFG